MDILDDIDRLSRRDSEDTLGTALSQAEQVNIETKIVGSVRRTVPISRIVVSGMGGSALAALLARGWLSNILTVPFEVVRSYHLPSYVDESTLVIASSCSGNTEETLCSYNEALQKQAQTYVIAKGGRLLDSAKTDKTPYVLLPNLPVQPRMLTVVQLKAIATILCSAGLIEKKLLEQLVDSCRWVDEQAKQWAPAVLTSENRAKQLALHAVGKTSVFFAGPLMSPVAYKWKISWNENAKNVSFWNEYPEFNHNEFMGWTSHPVDKPFAIFDIVSSLEDSRILERFELSDKLLSGKRPKAVRIEAEGDGVLQHLLWASILADFTSIYLGILNNVDPGPVPLIEMFKKELGEYRGI